MDELDDLAATDLARLTRLVARLRAPDGCPWDREQRLANVRAYLLEEAHETAAAIDRGKPEALRAELGDLLFQCAFVARLAEESGAFELGQATRRTSAPRWSPATLTSSATRRSRPRPRCARRGSAGSCATRGAAAASLLDDAASASMPSLLAAYRLTQKAAGVGFDWPDAAVVVDKLDEELAELRAEISAEQASAGERRDRISEELGDLLFTVANLARKLEIDPEAALAGTLLKFRRRFAHVEKELTARGRRLDEATLEEMDTLWDEAKREEE